MDEDFRKAALDYHRLPRPGKLAIEPTKRMATQRDLALAYSPGVAAACDAIKADADAAYDYTARGNLVGVISNGTAVLGLGNIGALAGKPVMEGKAVLFKKFAGIDVFDIEVDASDPKLFCDVVAALEPTFGAINLEDIKAPECFAIEAELRKRMRIPVFHDDQHGTAITVAAAVRNGLLLQGKDLADVKLVTSGAGAAALACVDLLVSMGLRPENVTLTDIKGVIRSDRPDMLSNMARYARDTNATTLQDALPGADIFMGLSAPRVLKPEWLPLLADHPLILALANPEPEIDPEQVTALRPDAIIATGRSDYANQVNNVLCFPFIFRGALDVGATTINEAMKIAAVEAIAKLARVEASEVVAAAYGGAAPVFGPDYIIPKPFDPRLILEIAPAVAKAAMDSGVARRPIGDFHAYHRDLERFVFRTGYLMRPVFERAARDPKRLVFSEGEDERVLRAAQTLVDDGIARPILLGRHEVIATKVKEMGLRLDLGRSVRVLDPAADRDVFDPLVPEYQRLAGGAAGGDAALGGRGDAAARRPGGCGDLWRHRRVVAADPVYIADHSAPAGREPGLRAVLRDFADRRAVFVRHLYGDRPDGGADYRDDPAGSGSGARLRHRAKGGAGVAFQLRRQRQRLGAQDAAGAVDDPRPRPGAGGGWRDARRRRPGAGDPRPRRAGQPTDRHRQPADHAEPRRRQHRLQPAEGGGGRHAHQPGPAGHVEADPCAGAERHGARHP
jgi:malate dehydrogenase (oxaloacetate-decarboxylating)(NADP+)